MSKLLVNFLFCARGFSQDTYNQYSTAILGCGCRQVATTSTAGELTSQLRRCFSHEVTVAAPDRMQRRSLLAALLGGAARSLSAAALDDAAAQSAGGPHKLGSMTVVDRWCWTLCIEWVLR